MLGFLSKMISQNVPKCQASFDKLGYIPEAGEHSFPWGRKSREWGWWCRKDWTNWGHFALHQLGNSNGSVAGHIRKHLL